MLITRRLAFRLFLIIFIVMLAGTAVFTTISVNWQTEQMLKNRIETAFRISDLIKRSTRYSMLLNRREDIYQILTTLGSENGIEEIRIYNKKGEITYSTMSGEIGRTVNKTEETCVACHVEGKPPMSPDNDRLSRIFVSPKGYRVLGLITPIKNESSCSESECHAHAEAQTILGVFDVLLPLNDFDSTLALTEREQWLNALYMFLAIVSVSGIFLWIVVNRPVNKLIQGTREIMEGNLAYHIPVQTHDEMGSLATSFNTMTEELQRANGEIREWTQTLEHRVEEKTDELKRAQTGMIQMEKMVSLGKLAATVAHELNNPLEGILTYAKLLQKRLRSDLPGPETVVEMRQELALIADETARCGAIVKNLLLFSRQRVGDFSPSDVRTIMLQSIKLIEHHLKMHNITLCDETGTDALIFICDEQQIKQALLALEINSVEAMPEGGTLTIGLNRTASPPSFSIRISDTGSGIPQDILPRIFEPFFTTKEGGNGVGLGLSVVHGIVERHGGTIDVRSRTDEGTTFTITFPLPDPASITTLNESHG